MNILLIYPYCLEKRLHSEEVSVPPIGIYYVGALLKENHYETDILNWHQINHNPNLIRKTLIEKKPDVIGFSILHANRWGGVEIARIAKQLNPKTTVVFGGIGATFLWEHFLTHFPEIDYVVLGEGEYTFLSLVKWLENRNSGSLKDIPGIAFRKGNRLVRTVNAEPIADLDALPNPANYFTYQHVTSSRGCPGKCTFCGSPRFWGNKVRFHSPDYFVQQLELLYRRGISFFYFSDDTFTLKKDHVTKICKKIIERKLNISWAAISRVNTVSPNMLDWMRKAGCIQISYGVESGSEHIRNHVLNKRIKTEQISKAFELTRLYGIMARAYFIYGSPNENRHTIQETLDLIRQIKPLSAIFYILDIFPGTALYSDFLQRTAATDDNIWLERIEDILYFETDPELDQDHILAFGQKLRSEFHESLPEFVRAIQLIDKRDLFERHADFLSRLAMTFSHGEYSGNSEIKGKMRIAENLFKRALSYHPDHRAYLGLGMIKQQQADPEGSIRVLLKGLESFPESEELNLCLGLNYMNQRLYDKALSCFLKFKDSKNAVYYAAQCYGAMEDFDNQSFFVRKLDMLQKEA